MERGAVAASAESRRLVSYAAWSTPGQAQPIHLPRILIAENHSSTALVGCSWTFDSALAGAAIVDGVAQHWLSWMLERSAHLVAGKPDWSWVSARGPRRWEYPPKSSPRCAG